MSDDQMEKAITSRFSLKVWLLQWYPAVLLVLILLQNAGVLTLDQVNDIKDVVVGDDKQVVPEPAPEPKPVPDVPPNPGPLTPEQISDLIQRILEDTLRERLPTPIVEDDSPPEPAPAPSPPPVEPVRVRVCDEAGEEIVDAEVEAGQLFRVSAVGCGQSIGWHPVKSGDVRLSPSTDGKEFCGYLTAGQWVEFSLTDFDAQTQASLRVICLTAPQPPPIPDEDVKPKPEPKPEPKTKNVRLFVVHNNKITPDAAIVLNANATWDKFTEDGNDWKFIEVTTEDEYERKVVSDAAGESLPTLVVYDKETGRKLTAEPLPKSVIALEGLVERYTGGK